MSPADEKLGWNWTFWKKVLRPVIEEIGSKSPLYAALVAPNSTLPIKASLSPSEEEKGRRAVSLSSSDGERAGLPYVGSAKEGVRGIGFCARETAGDLFILACKCEGPTAKVEFTGLPASAGKGEVMFESPRQVEVRNGKFTDWFGPFEVHVYKFRMTNPK